MLLETNLFETIDKIKVAIDRLQYFEPPEGYYLAFSGGKWPNNLPRGVEWTYTGLD